MRVAKTVVAALLILVFAWLIAAAEIIRFSRREATGPADAALVLGAAAWGNRPSPVYRERIAKAIELFDARQVRWIVLTGGSPAWNYPSEADVGRRYCLQHGIPDNAIVVEDRSRTTWENLAGVRESLAQRQIRTVLLVSDPLHMKRATSMARAQGLAADPAPTQTSRFRSWHARGALLWHETWSYLGFVLLGAHD